MAIFLFTFRDKNSLGENIFEVPVIPRQNIQNKNNT